MPSSRATDNLAGASAGEEVPRSGCNRFGNRRAARAHLLLRSLLAGIATVFLATFGASCASDPLPQPESPSARFYVERCGQCHAAYNPHQMTAAMWQAQVDAMQSRMQQAGIAPLSTNDRAAILDYLTRNAGTR
jgi:hypothetical protein